jgi:YgiT-type zinc finger domain-containing protein
MKVPMTKTTSGKRSRAVPRRRVLPDDACPACGTTMKDARGTLKLPVNGEEIAVPSASHLKCPRCGEIVLRAHEARRLHEDAIESYRRKHGLLSAGESRPMTTAPRKPKGRGRGAVKAAS